MLVFKKDDLELYMVLYTMGMTLRLCSSSSRRFMHCRTRGNGVTFLLNKKPTMANVSVINVRITMGIFIQNWIIMFGLCNWIGVLYAVTISMGGIYCIVDY